MNRWRQIEDLYHRARELSDREQTDFLDDACADDAELRREVDSLLAERSHGSAFMETLAIESAATELVLNHILREANRVGDFTITAFVGRGGMGEVYRARDTKLGRDVALKLLTDSWTIDSNWTAGIEREARLLAALNHPNIATIHRVDESHGRMFLVMEYVDGVTLAQCLKNGPVRIKDALRIALQMAEALEAAHERGVIHRDLKPSNVKVTPEGRVKLLDFGLAQALPVGPFDSNPWIPPSDASRHEVRIGTPAYMAPERVRGESADRRADVWAFGCILFELLTGRSPFLGASVEETLANVLESGPDLRLLPRGTSPSIPRLLRRCLEAEPRDRVQHIGDARLEIADALQSISHRNGGSERDVRNSRPWLSKSAGLVVLVVLASLAGWWTAQRGDSEPPPVIRSTLGTIPVPTPLPNGFRSLALAPDGTHLAYLSGSDLWLRALDRINSVPLPRATNPFFSPDGEWLAFFNFDAYALRKVSVNGGAPIEIASFQGRNAGGTWGPDDTIVFSAGGRLFVVREGEEPSLLIEPDREGIEYAWPQFTPDGDALLFTSMPDGSADGAEIVLLDLRSMNTRRLLRGGTAVRYLDPGYLIYANGQRLHAIAFDPDRGLTQGRGVEIPGIEIANSGDNGAAQVAISDAGTLAHIPPWNRVDPGSPSLRQLVWIDPATGDEEVLEFDPQPYAYPRVSPQGNRMAVDVLGTNREVFVLDFDSGRATQVSEGPTEDGLGAVWSHDGTRIYYSSDRTGEFRVYSRVFDGTGPEELLTNDPRVQGPYVRGPGNTLFFWKGPFTDADVGLIDLDDRSVIEWPLDGPFAERNPSVSPDGSLIAYESNESGGQAEVFIRPFPNVDSWRRQISIGGGVHPLWGPEGSGLLYYRNLDWDIMAVHIESSPESTAERPRLLFPGTDMGTGGLTSFGISPKDGRLLVTRSAAKTVENPEMTLWVTLNWIVELKRILPAAP